jgi:hypothetical protein
MKKSIYILLIGVTCTVGCTSLSLQRHTVNQITSVTDYRYEATLQALAMVAADPATIPSFSLISNGTTSITDTGIINPVTSWGGELLPYVFSTEAIAVTGSRQPQILWTIDPVADHTQLEAIRCACRWALCKENRTHFDCFSILTDPMDPRVSNTKGSHYGVLWRLNRIHDGWLNVGRCCDVPANARYKAHCGEVWAWVMPEGMEGLSEFTLVLQDIATLNVAPGDGSLPANITPPTLVTLWVSQTVLTDAKGSCVLADVDIDIVQNGDIIEFQQKGKKVDNIEVIVGQTVAWHNQTNTLQSATGINPNLPSPLANPQIPPLFDSGPIMMKGEARVLFDYDIFSKALGTRKLGAVNGIDIEYYSTSDIHKVKSKIKLKIKPVTIDIELDNNNNVSYINRETKEFNKNIVVPVGTAVIWHNKTGRTQTVASTRKYGVDPLFTVFDIQDNEEKWFWFTDSIYKKAGQPLNNEVIIDYSIDGKSSSSIVLRAKEDESKSAYAQTLVFQIDRIIKPECKQYIETAICNGVASGKTPHDPVDISWDKWMEWTEPYQGQRTSVKPGTATSTPPSANIRPSTRLTTILSSDQKAAAPKLSTVQSGDK